MAFRFVVDLSHEEGWGRKRWTDPVIPAFNLIIEMDRDSVTDYARTVNFQTGEADVKWRDQRGVFSRTTFVSRNDNVIVTRISANDSPVSVRFELKERHEVSW